MDELVNIPALPYCSDGGTGAIGLSVLWYGRWLPKSRGPGKSGPSKGLGRQKMKPRVESIQAGCSPRKASRANNTVSVPQTDTGERGEKPKVNERTFVKELGKTAVVSSQQSLPAPLYSSK